MSDTEANKVEGPALPPHLLKTQNVIGPALPPHLIQRKNDDQKSDSEEESCQIGPILPPHMTNDEKKSRENQIGPILPPHLAQRKNDDEQNTDSEEFSSEISKLKNDVVGPALPPHLLKSVPEQYDDSSSSEEETFGPLPDGMQKKSSAHIALEERALQMKLDKLSDPKEKAVVREEWMLELPEVKAANLGLGPRQFRSKQGPDLSDRSSWTEVGGSKRKHKKEKGVDDLKKVAELESMRERDSEQEAMSKKHKRHKESLVSMHQKKLKSEKEKQPTTERKPFNRETDLQVNRFDEAQKKAVLKKAQLLDDRFSSGQSKFL